MFRECFESGSSLAMAPATPREKKKRSPPVRPMVRLRQQASRRGSAPDGETSTLAAAPSGSDAGQLAKRPRGGDPDELDPPLQVVIAEQHLAASQIWAAVALSLWTYRGFGV